MELPQAELDSWPVETLARASFGPVVAGFVCEFFLREGDRMVGTAPARDPGDGGRARGHRPVRTYRGSNGRRAGDAITGVFIRAGLVPHSYLLTTQARKTGQLHTVPVTVVERDGRRWLIAPYGPVSWVRNARAAGRVTLRRRRETLDYAVREVAPEAAGPMLKAYVQISRPTRPYFRADKDAPLGEFIGEGDRHPVLELIPVT